MGITNFTSDQDESEEFLEVRYHATTPESPLSEVMGHMHNSALNLGAGGDTDYTSLNINEGEMDPCPPHSPEAPESPTIPRDVINIENNHSVHVKHRNQNSLSSKAHDEKASATTPDCQPRHYSRSSSNSSNDGSKLSVHAITKSSKHSDKKDAKPNSAGDVTYHEDDSPLTHVAAITHIESIQATAVTNDAVMKISKDCSVNESKSKGKSGSGNLTLHSTISRPEDAEFIEDLDSPESISKIDREDCFSWEQDGLQLSFDHVVAPEESPVTTPVSMTRSRDSVSESGKESVSSETTSASVSSLDRVGQACAGTKNTISSENSPSEKQRKSKAIRDKLSAAFHKSGNNSNVNARKKKEDLPVVLPKKKQDGDIVLKQDELGYPLAIFTKVSSDFVSFFLSYCSLVCSYISIFQL